MKAVCTVFLLLATVAAAPAQMFRIKSPATGRVYGPFRFRDGEALAIGRSRMILLMGMSTPEPGKDPALSDLLLEGAELQAGVTALKALMQKRAAAITQQLRALLPPEKTAYGQYRWDVSYGSGFAYVTGTDRQDRQAVWAQITLVPDLSEKERRAFGDACLEMPAQRFGGKSVRVLVGRLQLRVGANLPELQSDRTLDLIVGSFQLAELRRL